MKWVGLNNYKLLFQYDLFWTAVLNTLYFALSVPINIVSQLFLANLLTKVKSKVFSKIVRLVLYIPTIIGGVAISLIFNWLLEANYGVFNTILTSIGLNKIGFTTTKEWFMPSVLLIKWWSAGMNILVLQSALANVNSTLKEAAKIDGANDRQIFFKIVIPQISPMLYYTLTTEFIAAFQEMSTLQIVAGGSIFGPGYSAVSLSYLMYIMSFRNMATEGFGLASAVGNVLAGLPRGVGGRLHKRILVQKKPTRVRSRSRLRKKDKTAGRRDLPLVEGCCASTAPCRTASPPRTRSA